MPGHESLIIELEEAISSGAVDRRTDALRRLTDLFISDARTYSEDLIAIFDDVISRLAAVMTAKVRAELANRLAPVPNAPKTVIETLASDDAIEVAAPVLAHSSRLDDDHLVRTATTKSQQHLLAICRRRSLSEAVTDVLVTRGDRQVVHAVVNNEGARFSDAGFGTMVERSDGDDALAARVGLRRDIPKHHFLALIAKASDNVRRQLAAENPAAADEIGEVVADVAGKMQAEIDGASRDYTLAKRFVGSLHSDRALTEKHVMEFAEHGKFEETAAALSLLSGLSVEVVENSMLDERPDAVLVVTKAIGFCWATARLIMLLRTNGLGLAEQDLQRALRSFDRLQVETAQRAIRFYKARYDVTRRSA